MKNNAPIIIREIHRNQHREVNLFLDLPVAIYGDTPRTRNDIAKTRDLLKILGDGKLFLALRDSRAVGRMCCTGNPGITDEHGIPYGMVGLFECLDDYEIFADLIDHARTLFRSCNYLLFPFYRSTWHQYRLAADGGDRFHFFLEPRSAPQYAAFAERYGAAGVHTYYSYLTRDIDAIIDDNRRHFERLRDSAISIRPLDKRRIDEELAAIHTVSTAAFRNNPFYTDIPRDEFVALYRSSLKLIDADFCTIIENGEGTVIGYYFSIPDFTPLYDRLDLGSIMGKLRFLLERRAAVRGMIIKTVAILPDYRNAGIHGAATCHHALLARERGYRYIIAALIHEDNPSIQTIKERAEQKEYRLQVIKI